MDQILTIQIQVYLNIEFTYIKGLLISWSKHSHNKENEETSDGDLNSKGKHSFNDVSNLINEMEEKNIHIERENKLDKFQIKRLESIRNENISQIESYMYVYFI